VLQFLNVADWVCRHNFARWQRTPERFGMNIAYQLNLGPDAWPALLDLARNLPSGAERADLILGLRELARRNPETPPNWREQQFRRDRNAAALSAWARLLAISRRANATRRSSSGTTRRRKNCAPCADATFSAS
jgi:hypothetical protein